MVVAGLHGHVRGRAACTLACLSERENLRVRLPGLLVPRLPDDAVASHENAADDRVRMGPPAAALGELERALEAHLRLWTSSRYAAATSSASKMVAPDTKRLAPACRTAAMLSSSMPPSTWTGMPFPSRRRVSRMRP